MHDGQNVFDPRTSYTGIDWNADKMATDLIEKGKLHKIIIVGIYNSPDRLDEYSTSELGDKYMKFIVDGVKPFIDKTYRTRPEREHTATMGSSMGGLISFWLIWNYPDVFGMAGCLSPSFIYNRSRPIKMIKRHPAPKVPVRIYMDCGDIGGEKLLMKGCKRMMRFLRSKGMTKEPNFEFHHEPMGRHSELDWASRLWRPLEFMFGKSELTS